MEHDREDIPDRTPPEPLIIGTAQISTGYGFQRVRALALRSVPGLLVTELPTHPGSWVVTHGRSGLHLQCRIVPRRAAPWNAALRWLLRLGELADWTVPAHELALDTLPADALVPPAEDGWVDVDRLEPRRRSGWVDASGTTIGIDYAAESG